MTDTIKRRPDGSIDAGHYMARGRQMRAEAGREMLHDLSFAPPRRPPSSLWFVLAAMVVGCALPFIA